MRYCCDLKEVAISLENVGEGLAEWVRRAQTEHTTFVVLDAAKPIARLAPDDVQHCSGADLAAAVAAVQLTDEEARAWAADLRQSREGAGQPEDRWQ
jgi:hypothetical protein